MKHSIVPAILILLSSHATAQQMYSELWGEHGEKWTPQSRLPDFSFAGYRFSEVPLPEPDMASNVRDFGAKGDGMHDDTQAFIRAIEETESGAIFIPAGRYAISDILWIKKPSLVLRGEGAEKTILVFPKSLDDVLPNPSQTTSGRPTSNYSWSGGFIWIKGNYRMASIVPITAEAKRGEKLLTLEKTKGLKPGQRVVVELSDTPEKTLVNHLYSDNPGDTAKIIHPVRTHFVSRIASIDGNRVELERPLRTDIRKEWNPQLKTFDPTVSEVGIENLAFEFPDTPYKGHFTEVGRNAIAIQSAADCWVRNVRIVNCDSAIFLSGMFCSIDGLEIESNRKPHKGTTGHHGITFGTDCMLKNFDFKTHFIHDITLSYLNAGNVAKNGKGINLSFDHHKKGNHENLFCNLDAGRGSEIWRCGGGASLGKHCGARGTFWSIRSKTNLQWPPTKFGPDSMNLVGIHTSGKTYTDPAGRWFEAIPPEDLRPADIHAAQLARRRGLPAE
ncbi:MAG: hypothetical protein DRP64_13625 [Verrucomicrobia bacterium]|nr:MAG: hypothetical protein DRP64_13625 [Verrucomicrobiota bacterium]